MVTGRGAQAPGVQLVGIVRRVRLKEMRVILDLCSAIYIAYISIFVVKIVVFHAGVCE